VTENNSIPASLLAKTARLYRRAIDCALEAYGLSDATALPVVYIGRLGDGVRQGALAEELGIEGPSLVRLIDLLTASGLVERREDPGDRRAKTLHLTATGEALRQKIEAVLTELRGRLFAKVPPEDAQACLRVFERMSEAVGANHGRRA
jgi:MarR family transcriptional regulator, transcriptional regulator for hemolysin